MCRQPHPRSSPRKRLGSPVNAAAVAKPGERDAKRRDRKQEEEEEEGYKSLVRSLPPIPPSLPSFSSFPPFEDGLLGAGRERDTRHLPCYCFFLLRFHLASATTYLHPLPSFSRKRASRLLHRSPPLVTLPALTIVFVGGGRKREGPD